MKNYRAILIDLFWTTVDLDFKNFPSIRLSRGSIQEDIPSSGDLLYQELKKSGFKIERAHFLAGLLKAHEKAIAAHQTEDEIPSEDKFFSFLKSLGIFSDSQKEIQRGLAQRFTELHMNCMVSATVISDERRAAVACLAQNYPLALVSNFDHAPAGRRILLQHGIDKHFSSIVISHEHGKRKPHRGLFETALKALKVKPQEALMIGDSPREDIYGAACLSIDTAWVRRTGQLWPEDIQGKPTYIVDDLKDILALLPPAAK